MGSRRWICRTSRLIQQLLLSCRGSFTDHYRQIQVARPQIYRALDRRLGPAHESGRAFEPASIPSAVTRGCTRGLQLFHIQHPQYSLQRLRTHRQTLSEGLPQMSKQKRRLSYSRNRLHETGQQLLAKPSGRSRKTLLRSCLNLPDTTSFFRRFPTR